MVTQRSCQFSAHRETLLFVLHAQLKIDKISGKLFFENRQEFIDFDLELRDTESKNTFGFETLGRALYS